MQHAQSKLREAEPKIKNAERRALLSSPEHQSRPQDFVSHIPTSQHPPLSFLSHSLTIDEIETS